MSNTDTEFRDPLVSPAINLDECWHYARAIHCTGYGMFYYTTDDGKEHCDLAHRVMWFSEGREIPDGYELDHLCRVRRCINPAHLEAVTHQENMKRSYRAQAKLTKLQVINIKHCHGSISGPKLGELYGVGSQAIYDIWNGEKWKHLFEPEATL